MSLPAFIFLLFPLLTLAVPIIPSTNLISLSNTVNASFSANPDFTLNASLTLPNWRQRLTSRRMTDILTERQREVQTLYPSATIWSIFAGDRGLKRKFKSFNVFELIFRFDGGKMWDLGILEADGITVEWAAPPSTYNFGLPDKGPLPWPPILDFFDAERIMKERHHREFEGLTYRMAGAREIPTLPDPPPQFPVYQIMDTGPPQDRTMISAETGEIVHFW